MPDSDRESDLALLTRAARAAGAIALRHWRKAPRSWDKGGGGGPVSEADLEVNRRVEEILRGGRPGHGWLSEESPDDPAARTSQASAFVVDPIDGTRAFLAGEAHWSVSLAVVDQGLVTAGVVFLPVLDRIYAATHDGPAECNGQAISAGPTTEVLSNAASLQADHWPGGVPDLTRKFRASIANRLCLVAEGRFGAMLTLGQTWEWDVAAGSLIAARAGARVSDGTGAALRFNRPDPRLPGVIAAAPAVWDDLIARRTA